MRMNRYIRHLASGVGLVGTPARRKMTVLSSSALLFALVTTGLDILFPLWVTSGLGMSPAEWAELRSMRFKGVFVGVILLGTLADRFGTRRISVYSIYVLSATLALMGSGHQQLVWLLMPVLGALMSTVFVNMNAMVQLVSDRYQGVANSIYRSVGALAGIVSPVLVTGMAAWWGGYAAVLYVLAALLFCAGLLLHQHPPDPLSTSLQPLRKEFVALLGQYLTALRERPLINYILISQVWSNCLGAIGVFAAIRFTLELHLSDQQFGFVSTLGAALVFLAIAASGFILDRVSLRRLHCIAGVVAGLACMVMGASHSLALSILGYYVSIVSSTPLVGPISMWVSRAAGSASQTSAFSIHKVLSALILFLAIDLFAWLEPMIGIQRLLFYCGIAATLGAFLFLLLPEPPKPEYAK